MSSDAVVEDSGLIDTLAIMLSSLPFMSSRSTTMKKSPIAKREAYFYMDVLNVPQTVLIILSLLSQNDMTINEIILKFYQLEVDLNATTFPQSYYNRKYPIIYKHLKKWTRKHVSMEIVDDVIPIVSVYSKNVEDGTKQTSEKVYRLNIKMKRRFSISF